MLDPLATLAARENTRRMVNILRLPARSVGGPAPTDRQRRKAGGSNPNDRDHPRRLMIRILTSLIRPSWTFTPRARAWTGPGSAVRIRPRCASYAGILASDVALLVPILSPAHAPIPATRRTDPANADAFETPS
jgi:hypothetical protein